MDSCRVSQERGCGMEIARLRSPTTFAFVEGYDRAAAGDTDEFAGLSCPDDLTFVVVSCPPLTTSLCCFAPALAPVPAEDDAKNFYLAPIGNGPFQMDGKWRMVRDQPQEVRRLLLRQEQGQGRRRSLYRSEGRRDRLKEFQAGNLDTSATCPCRRSTRHRDRGESAGRLHHVRRPAHAARRRAFRLLSVVNNTAEPFNNADVRRGVSMAINREAICKTSSRVPTPLTASSRRVSTVTRRAHGSTAYDVDAAKGVPG